jgi:hypothetical protein
MLPRAQTLQVSPHLRLYPSDTYACSRTSRTWEERRRMKWGTAPLAMTTWVCWEVPEAMSIVSA